jgi:hypothetical protein
MKSMKSLACVAALALCAVSAQARCVAHVGRSDADPMALVATPSSLSVDTDGTHRRVITLGTITNPSGVCFTDIALELQYFDAAGQHVDTVVQSLPDVVSPAGEAVEFRVMAPAARDAKAYATQRVRVVEGSVRWVKGGDPGRSAAVDLLLSWLPMIVLIGVYWFAMRRFSGAKSVQGRMLPIMEQQLKAVQEQNAAVQRIAAALEKRAATDTPT